MPPREPAQWASLQERLAKDEELSKLLQSLESSLSATEGEPQRPRLKVPYATISSPAKDDVWK